MFSNIVREVDNIKIIKRNGSEAEFDVEKIKIAIRKASDATEQETLTDQQIDDIAEFVEFKVHKLGRSPNVEEIQNVVEKQIMAQGAFDIAKNYIEYRYKHSLARKANSTDDAILSLLDCKNEEIKQENSNKNPTVNSVQRDYMAGEVSKDITKRILLDPDVVEAHEQGIIHVHDTDYFAQHMHNCFVRSTRFMTSEGVKSFKDFEDGDVVIVLDKDGVQRQAIVHCYGKQKMNQVRFFRDGFFGAAEYKTIVCTPNHRWILSDGTVTTNLKEDDALYTPKGVCQSAWKVVSIKPYKTTTLHIEPKIEAWCVEEPITHSFTLEDGMPTGNCDLVNLEDMLQNGTVISGTMIEKPHSFSTACNITTQIIAQVGSNQFGGQTITLSHLVPFVDISRKRIQKQVDKEQQFIKEKLSDEEKQKIVESRLVEEINRGIQMIQYQLITLSTTNGQAPFVSVFMYLNEVKTEQEKHDLALLIEEMLKQRIQGVKNQKGVYISPAFPKLLYVLEEDNIHEDSKYWYLTELAAKCSAKRLTPDYISEKKMKEIKVDENGNGQCFPCMGCRSFLSPYIDPETKQPKYYGRFNEGVVTINLVDVACSSHGDIQTFWKLFDERLELCKRALLIRHKRLLGTTSDVAPILWQHGALARLKPGEKIDKLLFDGYATISLGYAGLYECTKYMTGKSHTDEAVGKPFALQVMQHMNDKCEEWKTKYGLGFSVYGTPLESTTYTFAKCLQKRFGKIPDVTDHNYITNSYHVNVREKIDAFTKLKFEGEFQKLSNGGCVSYVEVPNMQHNIPAVLQVIKFIYDNIMYAELNTKSDYCQRCGYDGEIQIVNKDNKLVWRCPNCGNEDQNTMNVTRRTCGYIGTQYWNQGRTQEIKDRVLHL